MSLKDFKSPYGIPKAYFQMNDENWLKVKVRWRNEFRYFYATNWTYFEKDLATEITAEEYQAKSDILWKLVHEEMTRRVKEEK